MLLLYGEVKLQLSVCRSFQFRSAFLPTLLRRVSQFSLSIFHFQLKRIIIDLDIEL